jgi:hypothetical protein
MKKLALLFFLLINVCFVFGQMPILKVDLNYAGRKESEVHEPGYISWVLNGLEGKTYDGVYFQFKNGATLGSWYKAGIQAPNYARLVSDGIKTQSTELHIIGLQAGRHTLVTFHNILENPEGNTFSPLDIYLNGELEYNNLELSVRALSNDAATTAYFELDVEENDTVVIKFVSDPPNDSAINQIMICGFHLNSSDPDKMARFQYPTDKDEHVDIDNDTLSFFWESPENTIMHNVYLGTNESEVRSATPSSPVYIGSIADTFFTKSGFYSMNKYYWRVDPITNEDTTKGDVWYFKKRIRSFPGAEGYGGYAIGGRGGKVVYVTNLNDSGPGSFREAVTSDDGPRTVLFNVSGIIKLKSRLVLDKNVTIAGQTAPGKGICFRSSPIGVSHECICRFIRMRLGAGPTADGIGMAGVNNGIVDHCSISWTIDESFSSRSAKNITLQRTLISEALSVAGHKNYPPGADHGFAGSISGDIGSFHHNLLAHNSGRNWSLAGGLDGDGFFAGRMDIFNNIVYNWSKKACYNGAHEVNFVNNYYKRGPGTEQTNGTKIMLDADELPLAFPGTQSYYFSGNVMPGIFDESNQEVGRKPNFDEEARNDTMYYDQFVDEPFFPSDAEIHSAGEAYKRVLSDVGCTQPVFDDHDQRIIVETLNGTYTYKGSKTGRYGLIDDEQDVGGFEDYPTLKRSSNWDTDLDGLPNWWEKAKGLDTNSVIGTFTESNADPDKDGYTNLEDYLNWMALPHYFIDKGDTIEIDLSEYSKGFNNSPVYSVFNTKNGKTDLLQNSSIVKFISENEGFSAFEFKLTDAASSHYSRTIGMFAGTIPQDSLFIVETPDTSDTNNLEINRGILPNSEISIYPNPVKDILTIDFNQNYHSKTELTIVDMSGKLLYQKNSDFTNNRVQINVTHLDSGTYILRIRNNALYKSFKLIK